MSDNEKAKSILVIEDEGIIQRLFRRILGRSGYELEFAASVQQGLAKIDVLKPDLLISDLKLPDGNGLDVVRTFKVRFPNAKAIIITGSASSNERLQQAKDYGVSAYLFKPFEMDEFTEAVRLALFSS